MPLIKPRLHRVRSVRHICRLQEPNRDALALDLWATSDRAKGERPSRAEPASSDAGSRPGVLEGVAPPSLSTRISFSVDPKRQRP